MNKWCLPLLCIPTLAWAQSPAEVIARFNGAIPTGVAVSQSGRIFVNFPRWGDNVTHTVAELQGGREVAYPNAKMAVYDPQASRDTLVSVQSVVVDSADRLWILDTGSIQFGPPVSGGPKLVGVNLQTNKVFQTVALGSEVVRDTTYLNDVRVDVAANRAYITDSGRGQNAIIVVDLKTGRAWRKLDGHPSVEEEASFVPVVEGKPLYNQGQHLKVGADGIALSADGKRLYYSALSGRRLYSVATEALANPAGDASSSVRDEGDKGGAADGLEMDSAGNIYATNYEHASVMKRDAQGKYSLLAQLEPKVWPDTLALGDGWLYCMTNQLHRQAIFQGGQDRREKPYVLYRMAVAKTTNQSGGQRSMETITTASGLTYEILKEGDGAVAKAGQTVTVHYTGWLTNGTKFASSVDRGQPFEFPLGGGRVIRGWDEGVAGMKIGEKRKLTIPAELGYGARGAGGAIPPNATLIFDVELLGTR